MDRALVTEEKMLTSYQVFVKAIHSLHVSFINIEAFDLAIFDDPSLCHALGKRYVAMLQRPANEQLSWRAGILLRQRDNCRMLHP